MAIYATGMSTVGAELRINGTTPANGTRIAEVFSISGPSYSQTAVDTTHHNSTSRFRTYVPGMSDAGEVNFDVRFIPSDNTHDETSGTGLVGLFGASEVSTFVLVFPDNGATKSFMAFSGIMTSFTPSADLDSSLDASATIKISGAITYTEAV